MPYDKDGKYFRKPVFNENFKGLKNKKTSDKASNIENNEKLEDYEYLKKFHEVNKNNTDQDYKDDDFKNNSVSRNLKQNYFWVIVVCVVLAIGLNQPVFWIFFLILSAILFPYKK